MLLGVLLFVAFSSYFFSWKVDQSNLSSLGDRHVGSTNLLRKLGAEISHFFIYEGVGIAAFILAYLLLMSGLFYFFNVQKNSLVKRWTWGLYYLLLVSFSARFTSIFPFLGGKVGFEITDFTIDYIGVIGLWSLLLFMGLVALVLHLNITPERIIAALQPYFVREEKPVEPVTSFEEESAAFQDVVQEAEKELVMDIPAPTPTSVQEVAEVAMEVTTQPEEEDPAPEMKIEVKAVPEEETVDTLSRELVEKYGAFDPTLELSGFKFPTLDLLKDYGSSTITIDEDELEANKNKIIDTLRNYKIEIKIKANIGPTVTLYEIVPAAGVRISKIKNLEDDIALSFLHWEYASSPLFQEKVR